MNLFKYSLQLKGYDLVKAQKYLQEPAVSDAPINIAQYHLKHNPFYSHLNQNAGFTTWEHLPVLRKKDFQLPLASRLSDGYSTKNIYRGSTSGSSGEPFTFAKDKFCHALTWASFYKAYAQYNIDLSSDLQARFYGMPVRGRNHYKELFKDFISGRYRFPIFNLSEQEMSKFLYRFKKRTYTYLNGYTSSIFRFAKFLESKNVVLKDHCPTLKVAIVTSETLFEEDRKLIEGALGVPVINEYGASETGLIAFENLKNQLIIDKKLVYVEILDKNDLILPYGKKGRIVVTSLHNKAHPFIRYEIGDLGSLNKDPATGQLYIEGLYGRTNDFVYLPSGKTVPGLAFYYVTKKAMQTTSGINELIVTQKSSRQFEVRYVSLKELNPSEKAKLEQTMIDYLEPGIAIEFIRMDQLKRSTSGKLKQFTGFKA